MRRAAIALVRLAIGALGVATAACGSSAAPSKGAPAAATNAPATPPPTASAAPDVAAQTTADAREDRRIARMLKVVSAARHLEALHPVPGKVLPRAELLARVKAHVDREVPPEAIRREGVVLQLLGMVPQKFDYEAATLKLLEAQLAGFYEPADGTMYMAADLDEDNADATLAHELVHALQDQHFDLKPHSKYVPGHGDQQSAFSALAEGDATSAMADVLIARTAKGKTALDLPEEVFVGQVLASVSSGPAADAPHVMRTSLVAPYVYGTLFVHALRRKGGWAAVDGAWRDLPTTSEQVLHVAKWEAREKAIDVKAPTFAALGAGWSLGDEDTYGELGLRLAYEEWTTPENAADAARGWGGDRGVLVENGDRAALGIHLRFDVESEAQPDAQAKHAVAIVQRGIEASVGKPKQKSGDWLCVERPQLGPIAIYRKGRDVALVVGPAKMGDAWAAAGDCALAKRWATEIVASP